MPRYRIDLSYRGTRYSGWQIQENANTVQAELNRALFMLLNEDIETTGCGRTDTGVHAHAYTAHFDCREIVDTQHTIYKLNCLLPSDIAISELQETNPNFHARFDAVERKYKYFIHQCKSAFADEFSYFFSRPLNVDVMNDAARKIIGTYDFTSFCKLHSGVKTGICTVYSAKWTREDNNLIFTVSANRFLRNMVRAMVGTLLDVGLGKTSQEDFIDILESKNRCLAGASVPAKGLFLWETKY
jgi:tRNA pseudouridine38-40 synthase